jgi:hypothetical protein
VVASAYGIGTTKLRGRRELGAMWKVVGPKNRGARVAARPAREKGGKFGKARAA